MKLIKYLSLLLILFSSINAKAESRKNQLDRLFNELKTDNPALTYETEQKIWKTIRCDEGQLMGSYNASPLFLQFEFLHNFESRI